MRHLGLVYGAIDMIRTPDGRHVFLEANPSGQWLWIEQRTGLGVSEALVDCLVHNAAPSDVDTDNASTDKMNTAGRPRELCTTHN